MGTIFPPFFSFNLKISQTGAEKASSSIHVISENVVEFGELGKYINFIFKNDKAPTLLVRSPSIT